MSRYKLTIEYDGTYFCGWQLQNTSAICTQTKDKPSVQYILEKAVLLFTHKKIRIHGAGRTDAGVHATGQVAHVDLPDTLFFCKGAHALQRTINALVRPHLISVTDVAPVPNHFHSRFSAQSREYLYKILLTRSSISPLRHNKVFICHKHLSCQKMQEAAHYFEGTHDMTSFCTKEKNVTKLLTRKIDLLRVIRNGDEIHITVQAQSFLHHQVRFIVGTLVSIGSGSRDVSCIPKIFLAKNNQYAGPIAPACGLYLTHVHYPD